MNGSEEAAFRSDPTGRLISFGSFPRAALSLPWAIFAHPSGVYLKQLVHSSRNLLTQVGLLGMTG